MVYREKRKAETSGICKMNNMGGVESMPLVVVAEWLLTVSQMLSHAD